MEKQKSLIYNIKLPHTKKLPDAFTKYNRKNRFKLNNS